MLPAQIWEPVPAHVHDALVSIANGSTADAQESLTLEFKEDPSHHQNSGNPRANLIEKLIDEAICMANSDIGSGHIVVGVSDKVSGPAAFTGTQLTEAELEQKIFNHTRPNMSISVSAITFEAARLIVIYIPEARSLYTRKDGAAKRRTNDSKHSCVPMTEEERRSLASARAESDYSNEPSSLAIEDITLSVINETRRVLRTQRAGSPDAAIASTTPGLLRELGLLRDDGKLKQAGEILLGTPPPTEVTIRHLWREFSGQDPKVTQISDPLILALPQLRRLISEHGNREIERVQFDDGQEIIIARFPGQAVDEIISNALIHRDWQIPRPVIVEQTKRVLKVISPGPLPPGVSTNRLLTTPSVPRNNRLMAAMRTLGLAEESSRGFDRMWSAMIRSGRDAPEVVATDSNVEVILAAQKPDVHFVEGLHRLAEHYGHSLIGSVNSLIVLWHLNYAPLITEQTAREKTQTSTTEARVLMDDLQEEGILHAVGGAREWVLSQKARALLGARNGAAIPTISVQEWIEAKLEDGEALQSADVADYAGITTVEAGKIFQHLRALGRAQIDPSGPNRGRGTRWIRTKQN